MKAVRAPRHIQKIALYLVGALFIPFLVICLTLFSQLSDVLIRSEPKPINFEAASVGPNTSVDPNKKTVLILASNSSTQISDLFIPYSVLSTSKLFNVYVVAPQKKLSNTTAGLSFIPHFDFKSAPVPDAVVIPAVVDHTNSDLISWVGKQLRSTSVQFVLSIGEGARLLANTGDMEGKSLTSHFISLGELRDRHPEIKWQDNVRVLENGKIISTAGITSAVDGTLKLVQEFVGPEKTTELADHLDLARSFEPSLPPSRFEIGTYLFGSGLDWNRKKVGIAIYPGINEMAAAAVLDTYSRTLAANLVTLSIARKPILSENGLQLVAELEAKDTPPIDTLLFPGGNRLEDYPKLKTSILSALPTRRTQTLDLGRVPVGQTYEEAIGQIAEDFGGNAAAFVAKMIELPGELFRLSIFGSASKLFRLMLLITLGLGIAHLAVRRFFRPDSSIQL